jgi:hypothetical protein
MSVAGKKNLYKVTILVIIISKDNSDWYKSQPHEWGQENLANHMKSKEEIGEIVIFLIEFTIIGCFCECVCELNEISMKGTRELLVP